MNKKITIIFILMLSSTLWAQSEFFNTVKFVNNTREDIRYLFFSPADSEYWGPDVLGDSRTLSSKGSVEFYISYPNETDSFDFLAIDTSGNVYEIYEESITDGYAAQIVINKTSKSDKIDLDSFEEELIGLEIMNETGLELFYLFVSPSDSEMYGIDFMDSETTLQPGASVSVLLFNSNAEVEYDVQGIDVDDDTYSFSLSLDPELEYQYVEIIMDYLDY
jgi:hypothetical protein